MVVCDIPACGMPILSVRKELSVPIQFNIKYLLVPDDRCVEMERVQLDTGSGETGVSLKRT